MNLLNIDGFSFTGIRGPFTTRPELKLNDYYEEEDEYDQGKET